MTVDTRWISHIPDPEDRKTFAVSVRSAGMILERLADILHSKMELAYKSSTEDYHLPAWPYMQADKAGYTRALREVIELTKLTPLKE